MGRISIAHVDDCLICCKSIATVSKFKQELLTRFQVTDEGQVKEYLGCEVIRDRAARTGKMVQAGYAERVLRTFGMWDCNPVLTPMEPKCTFDEAVFARSRRPSSASTDEKHCGMSLISG